MKYFEITIMITKVNGLLIQWWNCSNSHPYRSSGFTNPM